MCTLLLPPGDNPIAVNRYIISYHNVQTDGALTCLQVYHESKDIFECLELRDNTMVTQLPIYCKLYKTY
jgi:hypothetical protein